MRRERSFPPGVGWIPATIAVVAAAIVSTVAFVPQFTTRTVGTVAGNNAAGGAGNGNSGSAGTKGTGGHSVTGAGGGGAGVGGGAGAAQAGGLQCAAGKNGGSTAPGVSATEIHVASTVATSGIGSGFLQEAGSGMAAAINEANRGGGICGRQITMETVNSGWDPTTGQQDIENYVNGGNVFALVGEPDSEGLSGAIDGGVIDRAQIPVVGSDGMLKDQYHSPWVWPVAASTVSNMHIIAKYGIAHGAKSFGIVYDTAYKFGKEGANAFAQELSRLGYSKLASDSNGSACSNEYCGISSSSTSYSTEITAFNNACSPCDLVVMLLEPGPMRTWMRGEEPNKDSSGNPAWYRTLMGGEPLFDDTFAQTCAGDCGGLVVWTGYHAAIQPFDTEPAVNQYVQSLHAVCPSCDAHNEFTEGAYLGTRMFITALQRVGPNVTRAALAQVLNSATFDIGLSLPLRYSNSNLHLANTTMTAFSDNAQGSFNGWNYLGQGFLPDPATGQDL